MYRLILFDMDGTLLQGRTIFYLAEKLGFLSDLQSILQTDLQPYKKTKKIAYLLKGISKEELISLFHEIPLRPHVIELITTLKKAGFIIGLATDSYDIVANDIKNRLKLDYAFANNLIFKDSMCTGEVIIHNTKYIVDELTTKIYSISKSTVLESLCNNHSIPLNQSVAVGDGIVDCSMIKKAGLGIAVFASEEVNQCADIITTDMISILDYVLEEW